MCGGKKRVPGVTDEPSKITFISVQITTSVPHLPAWVPGEFLLLEAPRRRNLVLVME